LKVRSSSAHGAAAKINTDGSVAWLVPFEGNGTHGDNGVNFVFDAAGNPDLVDHGHENQMASRKGNMGGNSGSLRSQRFFRNLYENLLAFMMSKSFFQEGLDPVCDVRVILTTGNMIGETVIPEPLPFVLSHFIQLVEVSSLQDPKGNLIQLRLGPDGKPEVICKGLCGENGSLPGAGVDGRQGTIFKMMAQS
jgi:hypothetical protein